MTPEWAWEVSSSSYDAPTGVTEIDVTYGYDTLTYATTFTASGDHTADPEAYILTLPEFINSTGPIGAGGWPPPPHS